MISLKLHSGASLVEVLVAALVLTLGILASAHLQLLGLQEVSNLYHRTQADILLADMAERLRALDKISSVASTVTQWQIAIADKQLPDAQGVVTHIQDNVDQQGQRINSIYRIQLHWRERIQKNSSAQSAGCDLVSMEEARVCREVIVAI